MMRVNCAAIPQTLIESELFGREKGAYTGALSRQVGRFELAHGSTLFLDEVGELPLDVQIKLLRVLQEKQLERLGSPKTISVDVRIIAATNQDLEKAVREKRFRDDLYYRLNVFPIRMPPLRERMEDIPLLIQSFVNEFAKLFGKCIESIDRASIDSLQRYSWPGNIREMRNTVERAMILATGPRLYISTPAVSPNDAPPSLFLMDAERDHLVNVLDMAGWRIRGKGGAAEILGLKPTTLESMMVRLGISRRSMGEAG
jgi:transcriptional regulator with GAF, ATPase, and Fis domain